MILRIPIFDIDDDPPNDPWSKWGIGIVVPCLIGGYGITRILFRHAVLHGRRGMSMTLNGWDAVMLGLAILAVALFLHSRYFWSNTDRLASYAGLGQFVALLLGIAGIGFVVVRNFTLI